MPNPPLVQLQPHQRMACDFIKSHPYCGLFLEVGLGKTVTTLEALYELAEPGHVLIIGPKPVARSTWPSEIEKFKFPFRVNSLIVDEKGKQRSRANKLELYQNLSSMPPSLWFINREAVVDLVENLPTQGPSTLWPFPTVIIDEAQSFKSYKSKRFKALAAMRPAISRLIELSGTPTPNGLMDLWPLIYLIDQGERLGRNITAYRNAFFRPGHIKSPTGYPVNWEVLPWTEQEIYNRISDVVISMRDVLPNVPPLVVNDVMLSMSEDEWELYHKMSKESVLQFEDDHEAIAANAAVLSAKLLQMASGAIYLDGTNTVYQPIHSRKLDALVDILSQTNSPVLVAYHFRSDKELISKRLTDENISFSVFDGSPAMVDDWNAQKIPVMLLQPASAGHGLNLQHGGHTIIWYTMPWSLEHYTQTNARLHRQGQASPVISHRLMVANTIDIKVARALQDKNTSMGRLIDSVEYAMKNLSDDQTD